MSDKNYPVPALDEAAIMLQSGDVLMEGLKKLRDHFSTVTRVEHSPEAWYRGYVMHPNELPENGPVWDKAEFQKAYEHDSDITIEHHPMVSFVDELIELRKKQQQALTS